METFSEMRQPSRYFFGLLHINPSMRHAYNLAVKSVSLVFFGSLWLCSRSLRMKFKTGMLRVA